jgi:hypothetical protein
LNDSPQPVSVKRIATEAAVVLVLAWIYQCVLQFASPHMPGTDGYYHIKYAYLLRTEGIPESFPWAAYSLWAENFFDKDFGFHLFLVPFTYGDLIIGAKLAAVTMASLFFTSFYLVLRLSKIRFAWVWTIALAAAGGYFGWRVCAPRPQVISMILSMWAMFFALRWSWKGVFVVSVLYALSYTAPFVALGYAIAAWCVAFVVNRKTEAAGPGKPWIVVAAAVGIFVGWLLHPHFPNNFVALKVQLVDVLANAWGVAGPNLHLGGELTPAPWRPFIREHLAVMWALVAAIWALSDTRDFKNTRMLAIALIGAGFVVLTLRSKRFVEYSVPFTLWACAIAVSAWLDKYDYGPRDIFKRWRNMTLIGGALFVVLLGRSAQENYKNFTEPEASGWSAIATWLQENTESGTQVYTCDWDDAPEIFFFNHDNRYIVFLDPNYMYKWNPEVWKRWYEIANGRKEDPVAEIQEHFKSRHVVCTHNFKKLRKQLKKDKRAEIRITEGPAWLAEILPAEETEASTPAE